jgi:hypothetical protein
MQYKDILTVCCTTVAFVMQRLVSKQDRKVNASFCNYTFMCCDIELESVSWAGLTGVG